MPRDGAKPEGEALAESRIPRRDRLRARQRVDVGNVEAPGDQPTERVPSSHRGRDSAVAPDQRDPDRARVEPLRVRADHVPLDAAPAPLEDLAEAVDEEVVADVVPAVSEHVVDLDPAD